jgi:hypothetical protein
MRTGTTGEFKRKTGAQPRRTTLLPQSQQPLERWTNTQVVGGQKRRQLEASVWWWRLCDPRKDSPVSMAYEAGHRRWDIESKAFKERTQYYHLERGYPHEPVVRLA